MFPKKKLTFDPITFLPSEEDLLEAVKESLKANNGRRGGGRLPFITEIAVLATDNSTNCKDKIRYRFTDFLSKYYGVVKADRLSNKRKMDRLMDFCSSQQETETSNNFCVINSAGQVWELPDFIKFVKEWNDVHSQRTIIYSKD